MTTKAQARVVDPVQTSYARGYTQPGFAGHHLFPKAPVDLRGAKMIKFNKDSFKKAVTARAPGTAVRQHRSGYESDPISIGQHALAAVTPFELQEEAAASLSFDLHRDSLDEVLEIMSLSLEVEQAETALNAAAYDAAHVDTPAGTDLWTDDASKPKTQIEDAKETIRKDIGRKPNVLLLSPTARKALNTHPELFDIIKRSGGNAVTDDLLARFFDIEKVVVGEAVSADAAGGLSDVWGTGAILGFVSPPTGSNRRNRRLPSYGYTHQLKGYPYVTPTRFENGINSHQSDVFDEWSVDMVGPDAGYLITTTDGN